MKFPILAWAGLALAAMTTTQAATVTYFANGSQWRYRLGTNEASAPVTTWRTNVDDTGWSAPVTTPLGYGDPIPTTIIPGSTATTPNWLCVFMRRTFFVTNPADFASASLTINIDDGYIIWLNGTEVGRYNMPSGAPTTASFASSAIEPTLQSQAVSIGALRAGTNVIAIQAFNSGTGSSDLYVDANFVGTLDDTPPTLLFQLPYEGSTLTSLNQIEVDFSRSVSGVDAADLLIGGQPATNVTATSASVYVFQFPPKAPGVVNVQFAAVHGIQDQASSPHPFAGGSWSYVVDPNYVPPQTVRLNELLTANVNGLRDEDNEPQDWVELKNTGSNVVSLAGWSLTDDPGSPDKWVFPSVPLPGGGLMVVFCSAKDRKPTAPGSKLHTNFKLNPDGEYLGLFNAESPRLLVSAFAPYPNQRRDISYGYDPGGQLRYFTAPSPGTNNAASAVTGIVSDTKFSVNRGFFTNAFSLSITCATPGVTIRYTLDGKAPTPSVGSTYAAPLTIGTTTVVRAYAYKSGLLESDIDSQTYIFINDVVTQAANGTAPAGWPATWGGNTVDYGMDPDIVNNPTWGATIRGDLLAIPTFSIVMNLDDLFGASGIYANPGSDGPLWERPCSIEMLRPDGEAEFQINCGVRLRGGFSRSTSNPKHAFRFFFRQEYGASKLNFPFFGPTGAAGFDKFDMRTMQNYSWSFQNDGSMICLRDVMSRDAQLTMNGIGTRGNFYHLYINGMYWGLYNSEERPEAAFAESYIGGREEDYDTIKQLDGYLSGATDGDNAAWYRLWEAATNGFASDVDYFKVQGLNVDGTINTNYENLVDVPNMIDYMLVILYGGNLDAPISNFLQNDSPNNWYGFRDRTGKHGGFRFASHDAEHTFLPNNGAAQDRTGIEDLATTGGLYGVIKADWTCGDPVRQALAEARTKSTPQYIWFRMHQNAEFRMLAADRIQKHLFNGGALSVAGMRSAFLARSNEIQRAIVAESARWGDSKRATPFTRTDWINAITPVWTYINGRTATIVSQLQADGLFPAISAPVFSSSGGAVTNGLALYMTNNNASTTLYYTLDGSDPRLRGGGIAATALAYTPGTPIVMNFPTTVRARVVRSNLTPNVWSAITEATFYPGQDFSRLMISEIMFNPPALGATPGDELEFIELKNAGATVLDLTGLQFTDGVDFTFTNGTRLSPGQFLVLGRNTAALAAKYPGLAVLGLYTKRLNNGGESITLQTVFGAKLLSVDYKSSGRWPITADGFGFSIVPRNPNSSPNPDQPSNWRASTNPGGSPGTDDPAAAIATVLVNEVFTHSTPSIDFVELFNPGAAPVNLGGWFITDDPALPMKYRVPNGTSIGAGGYLTFDESTFNATPGTNGSFTFAAEGEAVYLLSGDAATTNLTGYSHGFTFDASPAGVSFGRHVISTGEDQFVLQSARTSGVTNASPAVGPVVIRQIMYHPPDLAGGLDNGDEEYVELRNITGSAVQFYDPAASTNTWHLRGGVQYDFPGGFSLGAGSSVVLVSFDSSDSAKVTAFRNKYGTFASVPILGPYSGKLDNSKDSVELKRPDVPTTNGAPYYTVDLVEYRDLAPWSPAADGSGAVLQRASLTSHGNDPANWIGAAPLVILSLTPANSTVRVGTNANVTFTVTAAGTSVLTYQWRRNGVDLPGATTNPLTILNVQAAHAGTYTVLVSDVADSALSPPAILNVLTSPTILSLTPVSVSVKAGTNAATATNVTFTVSAAGAGPLSYQWRKDGVNIPGATGTSHTIVDAQLIHAGAYSVAVTDLSGTTVSQNAFLAVAVLPVIIQPPLAQTVVQGQTVTLSAVYTGTPPPFTNEWRIGGTFQARYLTGETSVFHSFVASNVGSFGWRLVLFNASTDVLQPGGVTHSPTATITVLADTDHDGMPDAWETANGFNPNDAADGLLDADSDGMNNRSEFIAGTNPTNNASFLRIDQTLTPGLVTLGFEAMTNRTYMIECKDGVNAPLWTRLAEFPARSVVITNRVETLFDPGAGTNRIYRVVTPRLP